MTTVTKKKTTTTKAVSLELPKNPFVFEVLDLVSKQRSKAKKIEVLKMYEHISQASSNGTLSTKITEEVRRMHETDSFSMGSSDKNGHTTIRREYKHFYHFIRGGNDSMSNVRRETMFINILEGLHPLEAEVVCLCKDKNISDRYNITKEIVSEAYPDITWGNRS